MIAQGRIAAQVLGRASASQKRISRGIANYVAIRHIIIALALLAVVDILLPLPGHLRGLLLLWMMANATLSRRRTIENAAPQTSAIARMVEAGRPELDNALIHAVQFQSLLESQPDHPSADLMRRELERGEREASRLSESVIVPTAPLRRESRAAQIALVIALVSLPVFPRAWRFEAPRLLAFWQDNPPFTLTDFAVLPGNAPVRLNSGVTVIVRLSGLLPPALELVSAQGAEAPQSAPMLKLDERTFSARMENVSNDTWYYARGETGRSPRYLLRVKPAEDKEARAPDKNLEEPNAPKKNAAAVDAEKPLRELADAQTELARDAKQNLLRHPKAGDVKTSTLRRRQQELARQADGLAKQEKRSAKRGNAPAALEQARQAMHSAATGPLSKNAQAAAEKLQQAVRETTKSLGANNTAPITPGNGRGVGSGLGRGAATGTAAGTRRMDGAKPTEERALSLSRDRSGSPGLAPPSGSLPTGKNGDVSRYPVEYRRLVQDYFKSVAGK